MANAKPCLGNSSKEFNRTGLLNVALGPCEMQKKSVAKYSQTTFAVAPFDLGMRALPIRVEVTRVTAFPQDMPQLPS